MLELRPCCEHCAKLLPPASGEAMICSFECTFCADCVETLRNVCPNCGGGFNLRPMRPANNWRNGNYLGSYPAASKVVHSPVDLEAHEVLLEAVGQRPAQSR